MFSCYERYLTGGIDARNIKILCKELLSMGKTEFFVGPNDSRTMSEAQYYCGGLASLILGFGISHFIQGRVLGGTIFLVLPILSALILADLGFFLVVMFRIAEMFSAWFVPTRTENGFD